MVSDRMHNITTLSSHAFQGPLYWISIAHAMKMTVTAVMWQSLVVTGFESCGPAEGIHFLKVRQVTLTWHQFLKDRWSCLQRVWTIFRFVWRNKSQGLEVSNDSIKKGGGWKPGKSMYIINQFLTEDIELGHLIPDDKLKNLHILRGCRLSDSAWEQFLLQSQTPWPFQPNPSP